MPCHHQSVEALACCAGPEALSAARQTTEALRWLLAAEGALTGVSLFLDEKHVRAWPGGGGDTKIGSNYAPTIQPQVCRAPCTLCVTQVSGWMAQPVQQ
jgi:hypothetical protein